MISNIRKAGRDTASLTRMLDIWEGAVRATHAFLQEQDIEAIKPDVLHALKNITKLYCYVDDSKIEGFIGIENHKIEMLFIDAATRGKGIGKQLARYAITDLGAVSVDVNEQNEQGVGFYKHIGFHVAGRSETDEQDRPFPILHMRVSD